MAEEKRLSVVEYVTSVSVRMADFFAELKTIVAQYDGVVAQQAEKIKELEADLGAVNAPESKD